MKFTVLLMLPDDLRADQCCAADEVTRQIVHSQTVEGAIKIAQAQAADDTDQSPDDFAVVAVYPGHQFDLFQP